MSIFEYNKEEEERKLRKAEFEAGVKRGIEQARVMEIQNLIKFARELRNQNYFHLDRVDSFFAANQ